MITLRCTQCQTLLEMDDGFAGGACRCKHCGAIQTVPSHLKTKQSVGGAGRTLYQNQPRPTSLNAHLEQLADVVASSGLRSSRLRKPLALPPAQTEKMKPLVISLVAVIVVLTIVLIYLLIRRHAGAPA